jgi:tetratricopeptide (TPR) repeat protein
LLANLGDREGAAVYFRKCLSIAQSISAADPTDRTARFDVSMARLRIAITLADTNARDEALQMVQKGLAETDRLLAVDPQNKRYLGNGAVFRRLLGNHLRRAGDYPTAILEYERALELMDRLRSRDPSEGGAWLSTSADVLKDYCQAVGGMGDPVRAAALEKRVIELAELAKTYRAPVGKDDAPLLYAALGEMRLALGEVETARAWLEKSADGWQKLQSAGNLNTLFNKEPARVAALLAQLPRQPGL